MTWYIFIPPLTIAACWALVWLEKGVFYSISYRRDMPSRLLDIWRNSQIPDIQYFAAWAIEALPIVSREKFHPFPEKDLDLEEFLKSQFIIKYDSHFIEMKGKAALVVGYYFRKPWNDNKLAKKIVSAAKHEKEWCEKILKYLGEAGEEQLEAIKQKTARRKYKRKRKRNKD